jgi:hypothetical protein
VVQSLPLHWTPAFWQVFAPAHVMSHLSALQRTPPVHAVPARHFTVQAFPLHATPPFAHALEPSHVMSQRSVALQSMPATHAPPFVHVTSQNEPPHASGAFAHALEPSQFTLQPAAAEQSTPAWQALPPMQRMSHVWLAGQTAAQLWVHAITHQPFASQLPFAAVHAAGSQKAGPASGAASVGASTSPSPGVWSTRVLKLHAATRPTTRHTRTRPAYPTRRRSGFSTPSGRDGCDSDGQERPL